MIVIKKTVFAAAASMLILAGCSQDATSEDKSSSTATSFKIPDTCKDHYLLAAMPEAVTIASKPLTSMECQPFSVAMEWGAEGARTQLTLVDSQGPVGDLPAGLAKMAREMPLQTTQTAIIMTEGVRETALSYPASMEELGGPDYLSIVKEGYGMKYAMEVEPKDAGGQVGAVLGIAKDRYVVTLGIEHDHIKGVAAGEAAYGPWLSALRLGALQ